MTRKARYTAPLFDLDTLVLANEEFVNDVDTTVWTVTASDAGTGLVGDDARGVLTLTPADGTVTDNDEIYALKPNSCAIFAASRPLYFRCRLQFTETAAGVYNAACGFGSAVAANFIVDNGGGLRTSGCYAAIEKRDGETQWRLSVRNGTGNASTLSTATAGGANYQTLEVAVEDFDATTMVVTGFVDGVRMKDSNGVPIRLTVAVAGAVTMAPFVGAKLGAITNNDLLLVDLVYAHQLR
jgi:hypothetical protein